VVKNGSYGQQDQGRLWQREVFIDVRFVPPVQAQTSESEIEDLIG